METKHTPGPWQYGFPTMNGTPIREVDCQVMSRGCLIANVSHGPIYPAEPFASEIREANARLMAAAPDLLEALHEGRRAIGSHVAPNDCYATGPMTGDHFRDLVQCPACSFIAMYDAAIAKATKG